MNEENSSRPSSGQLCSAKNTDGDGTDCGSDEHGSGSVVATCEPLRGNANECPAAVVLVTENDKQSSKANESSLRNKPDEDCSMVDGRSNCEKNDNPFDVDEPHMPCNCNLKPNYVCHLSDDPNEEGEQQTLEQKMSTLTDRTATALAPDPMDMTVLKALEAAGCVKKMALLRQKCKDQKQQWQQVRELPVQDALWIIGEYENVCYEEHRDDHVLRVMAVFEVHGNTKHLLGTSIGWSKIMNFKTQLLQLLCSACLEPLVKAPRRPRFLRIKASPQSRGLNLNLKGVGIHVFSPLVTDSAIANAQNHISDKMWFRSCHGCGRRGTSEMFTSCPDCDAVLFCDAYCRDYSDHSKWCPYFKVYMETEETLGEFPLAFTNETTQRLYNVFKNRDFLMRHNIYNKGIWRRECKLLMVSLMAFGFGELDWPSVEPYGLSKEDAILKHPPQRSIPSLSRPLTDWACYYDYRGFDHDSPVAGVLHYALTLYRIIVHQLPLNYPAVFNKMKQEMFLCVHVIGAAKEADMWHSFLECARLLRPISLHICFIGNEISPDAHDSFKGEENLCVRCFSGLYHELQRYPMFPEGHIAVCFNAGLGAYGTYKKTVQHLMSTGMPSFCTDYCLASYEQSRKTVRVQRMAVLSEPMLNPFRSPFRMVFTDTDLPRYSNAILFNLLPYSATTAPMVFVPRSFCKNHSKQECTSEVYKLSLLPDDL